MAPGVGQPEKPLVVIVNILGLRAKDGDATAIHPALSGFPCVFPCM